MSALISFAKWIGGPGSIGFLVLCCALGGALALIGPRSRRVARAWLLLVFAAYFVAALPFVSHAVSARLPAYTPVWTPDGTGDKDILVVLSGDNAFGRARETRRILDVVKPRCVLVSGSRWFVRMLIEAGVARDQFRVDNTTTTTREQIGKLSQWAEQCGAERVVLVASTLSMSRVAELARVARVPVVLAPSAVDSVPATSGVWKVVPSYGALRMTRDAVYEHIALAYYRHRRWIH